MKILFDLSHPAHYHLFKVFARERSERGDTIAFAVKQKDVLLHLIEEIKGRHEVFIKTSVEKEKGMAADLKWLLENDLKLVGICRKFKPDLLLSTTFSAVHAGALLGIPNLFFLEDDFVRTHKLMRIVVPFTKGVICPVSTRIEPFKGRIYQYSSYQELAYLHPEVFTPDPSVVSELERPYAILRLADLRAHHDTGRQGITNEFVHTLLKRYEGKLKFYISAERELPGELESLRFPLHPSQMHHALAHARIVMGDSATIMAEAAVLGTPAVYTGYFVGQRGYLDELENPYGLLFGITDYNEAKMIETIDRVLAEPETLYEERRQAMLRQRYNPVPFFHWLVDNLPASLHLMQRDAAYEQKFLSQDE